MPAKARVNEVSACSRTIVGRSAVGPAAAIALSRSTFDTRRRSDGTRSASCLGAGGLMAGRTWLTDMAGLQAAPRPVSERGAIWRNGSVDGDAVVDPHHAVDALHIRGDLLSHRIVAHRSTEDDHTVVGGDRHSPGGLAVTGEILLHLRGDALILIAHIATTFRTGLAQAIELGRGIALDLD